MATKVTSRVLANDSVGVAQLSAGAVTEAKIADSNVTTAKIADNAITAAKLDSVGRGSGIPPVYGCRAWVNFDGTRNTAGTVTTTGDRFIRASGNVSRVARVDFGRYTVFFTTPMLDTNYCVNGSAADTRYTNNAVTIGDPDLNPLYQTGSFNICITNTTSYDDRQHVNVTVFR